MYLSARARTESLVLIRVLGHLTRQCDEPGMPPERRAVPTIMEGWTQLYKEGFVDLPVSEGLKIHRRIIRLSDAAMQGFEGTVATPILAVHYVLQDLIDEGRWPYVDNELFIQVYNLYSHALQDQEANVALFDQVDRSARKAAKRIRARLAEQGYFVR